MSNTKTIEFNVFTTPMGVPTCMSNEGECWFLATGRFGTRHECLATGLSVGFEDDGYARPRTFSRCPIHDKAGVM